MTFKVDMALSFLAKQRALEAQLKAQETELDDFITEKVIEFPEYAQLQEVKANLAEVRKELERYDSEAREVALEVYKEHGLKDFGGAQVKEYTKLNYSEQDAITWCVQHTHLSLIEQKLRKKEFEKVAVELKPDFVTVEVDPRVTISKDLSDYLDDQTA